MKKTTAMISGSCAIITMFLSFMLFILINTLLMANPIVENTKEVSFVVFKGYTAIFGGDLTSLNGITSHFNLAWPALMSWILLILAFVDLVIFFALEIFKSIMSTKMPKVLNILSSAFFVIARPAISALLIVSATFFVFAPYVYMEVNNMNPNVYDVTAMWIIAIALTYAMAIFAQLPSIIMNFITFIMGFFQKRKQKESEIVDAN